MKIVNFNPGDVSDERCFSVNEIGMLLEKKICVFLTGVEPRTFCTSDALPLARGPFAMQVYYRVSSEGKICDRRAVLMLVGQDRSGKTSLKNSSNGIGFDKEEQSSMGIDLDTHHFRVKTEIWMAGRAAKY